MDRFEWTDGRLKEGETFIKQQIGVKIYDGPEKTAFEHGVVLLTHSRLLWKSMQHQGSVISLSLPLVLFVEEMSDGRGRSPKLVLHLNPPPAGKAAGPVHSSPHTHIRLGFKEGGALDFNRCLSEVLSRKVWEFAPKPRAPNEPRKIHAGIVGIERNLEKQRKETDQNISKAFEDLDKLIGKAKEMVELSKKISTKIKEKQGDISEDETIKFKSYLLSLGISDPVTHETHGKGLKYHEELAKQLVAVLQEPIEESGGMMALTDVFCRINRARGIELLSPDDLLDACKQFSRLKLPLRLRMFNTGVVVLESISKGEDDKVNQAADLLNEKESLTADELAQVLGISVLLARGRLLAAEENGKACRDESVEGLRFYPNKFLEMDTR
ncbi:Vacuolar protein-sorting-associated protein 36 [Holothuria leucospilota]|uniref:Vacuolar protein-sorting-associated protein 36 n=1 Tax=Holothuria leucospilota TaxID=206669 RepID=A0A9Q1BK69_HOLLE|nr:Vacuolar protein-sorting-associated protein 36 [Holothuria leucospilota]